MLPTFFWEPNGTAKVQRLWSVPAAVNGTFRAPTPVASLFELVATVVANVANSSQPVQLLRARGGGCTPTQAVLYDSSRVPLRSFVGPEIPAALALELAPFEAVVFVENRSIGCPL